jgi:transcriptional regulator with XRE-family HTH domain
MDISEKLKSIRKELGLTQGALAEKLGVTRASIGAYEESRATPKYQFLLELSALAGVSLDEIIGGRSSKIKLGKADRNTTGIPLVPVKAAAGYQKGYPDEEFVKELPHFTLPILGKGNFRAFEITGDSMLPLASGTIIIGEKLERLSDLKDGHTYVLITRQDGIVYKRVFNYLKENGVLFLVSDNEKYKPYSIDPMEIHEAWSAKAYISIEFPETDVQTKAKLKKQFTSEASR